MITEKEVLAHEWLAALDSHANLTVQVNTVSRTLEDLTARLLKVRALARKGVDVPRGVTDVITAHQETTQIFERLTQSVLDVEHQMGLLDFS